MHLSRYISAMCTRTNIFNLIKTLKNPCLGRAPSNHQYVLWDIWALLLQPYSSCALNSNIRKYFFLVPDFLGFIPQSFIIRTQTVINTELCSCWKVQVSSIKIFRIFFRTYRVLTISFAGKFDNAPVAIFTQSMEGLYFVFLFSFLRQYGAEFCRHWALVRKRVITV